MFIAQRHTNFGMITKTSQDDLRKGIMRTPEPSDHPTAA